MRHYNFKLMIIASVNNLEKYENSEIYQPKGSRATRFPSVISQSSPSESLSGTVRAYLLNICSKFAGTKLHFYSSRKFSRDS